MKLKFTEFKEYIPPTSSLLPRRPIEVDIKFIEEYIKRSGYETDTIIFY